MSGWELRKAFSFQGDEVRFDIRGEGPPLVLVHGTPFSSFVWRNIVPTLAERWTVHYYDLLGYGASAKRADQDVSLGVQNEVLAALLDHWGLDCPAIVGHDFGGATVLRTHLLNKRDFARIALIDAVSLAPWGSPFFAHVAQHESVFQGVPGYIHKAMVEAYIQNAAYRDLSMDVRDALVAPWLGAVGQDAFYRQIAQADQRYTDEVEPLYGSIERPVLILWGAEDVWLPLEVGKRLAAAIPTAKLTVLPEAGHLAQIDAPEAVAVALVAFLSAA